MLDGVLVTCGIAQFSSRANLTASSSKSSPVTTTSPTVDEALSDWDGHIETLIVAALIARYQTCINEVFSLRTCGYRDFVCAQTACQR